MKSSDAGRHIPPNQGSAYRANAENTEIVLRGHQDLSIVKDVPEKAMADIWQSDKRNALQDKNADRAMPLKIERIKVR